MVFKLLSYFNLHIDHHHDSVPKEVHWASSDVFRKMGK